MKAVLESTHVINRSDFSIGENDLSSIEMEELLKIVTAYWIDIRGRAFIKAWVDEHLWM